MLEIICKIIISCLTKLSFMLHQLSGFRLWIISIAKGTIGLDQDSFGLAVFQQVSPFVVRVELNLIHAWYFIASERR